MSFLLKYIELLLAGIGIIMMFLVPYLLIPETQNIWKFVALAGVIITIIHGFLIWIVRRRQRFIRREVIDDVKLVLQDRIYNNLTKISMGTSPFKAGIKSNGANQQQRIIDDSIKEISSLLENLSEDDLDLWKHKYLNSGDSQGRSSETF